MTCQDVGREVNGASSEESIKTRHKDGRRQCHLIERCGLCQTTTRTGGPESVSTVDPIASASSGSWVTSRVRR